LRKSFPQLADISKQKQMNSISYVAYCRFGEPALAVRCTGGKIIPSDIGCKSRRWR
jgi:hypothetical protein